GPGPPAGGPSSFPVHRTPNATIDFRRMKILILGGPFFVGRYCIEAALARGHEVSVFNRGRHHADLYPEVEKLRGEREGDLAALRGRSWDAVIDTCGYLPRVVRASAELLADAAGQYTFISSVSVYDDFAPGMDESAPTETLTDEQLQEAEAIEVRDRPTGMTYGALYGPLKAACERAAEEAMPGRVLNVRAGLIVGPHDYSDRFTYWVHRVAAGGDVLAPGRPDRLVQHIDVRDLTEWVVRMIEANRTGIFNVQGPDYPLTMQRLLEECRTVSGSDARLVWASESFLMKSGVTPWSEMPLWIPEEYEGHKHVGFGKALSAGLTFRPLAETVRDTLAWDRTRPPDRKWLAGLTRERELQLLRKWREG
ncbi:MAG TPA: NAD-dependent epimerase/dehydratase family protein, partial [Thermoanaerobaculia bacterium]|nr:NAD-dependent epimerase/dehydratase family protein [Thermoanaerobaculia bacterium]